MRACFFAAVCLLSVGSMVRADQPETLRGSRPNIVIMFMDDMAYGDIGPFGAKDYPTPNLDKVARQGRRFTDFLVSSAVCSASRAALMTGCYHRRVGISGALGPQSQIGLSPDETTIAEICKSAGYRTACYGKWHLGHLPKFLPTKQGFDHFYGIPYSNDMWPRHPDTLRRQAINPNDPGAWPPLPIIESYAGQEPRIVNADVQPSDQEQMTVELTRRAVAFIEQSAKPTDAPEPFLLYLPHPMVHVPLYVSERFAGKSGVGLFGDVMMEVDWSVGEIIAAIDRIGQTNQTLFVFTSDNGPWLSYGDHAGSAGPLREGKGTMWEGGVREPTLMHWPTVIPPGTTCDRLASTIDLLPTIADLVDVPLPQRPIDGVSITSLMVGDGTEPSPRAFFAGYYNEGELQTIRNERFKLVFPHRYRTMAGRPGGTDGMPADYKKQMAELVLYDLDADVGETQNVIEKHPEVVAVLQNEAERTRTQFGDKLRKAISR